MSPSRSSSAPADERHARILAAIAAVPRGRVATYGTIARAAGLPGRPRLVGRVLAALPPGNGVPWHRVVNAGGRISRPDEAGARLQRRRLAREGVRFTLHGAPVAAGGRVDLARHGWSPPGGNRGQRREARA